MADEKEIKPRAFRPAFYQGLVTQVFVLLLASLILDCGEIFGLVRIFAITYLIMVLWIGWKRSKEMTRGDELFIRSAPIFFFFFAFMIANPFYGWYYS